MSGAVVWPGTGFNGRTCSVVNGSPTVTVTGNLAEDVGSSDPGGTGMGFIGPDDRLYCIVGPLTYSSGPNTTSFTIHRGYIGSTVASGGRFDLPPFQGLSSAAAYQLALLLANYTPTLKATRFANTASLPTPDPPGQIAWVDDGTGLVISDGSAWQSVGGGGGSTAGGVRVTMP